MKYYYEPVKDEIVKTYIENAGDSPFAQKEYELSAVLVVEAENEEASLDIRKTITHLPHWVLVKTEE